MAPTTAVPNCAPLSTYPSPGPNVRPAKGVTGTGTMTFRIPPLYRNPFFFTSGGQPKVTACTATSTGVWTSTQTAFGADKGKVQRGYPISGSWNAVSTVTGHLAGFTILPAPPVGQHKFGLARTGQIGERANVYPYIYSYTYGTLRNDHGVFGPGYGPGSFTYQYGPTGSPFASIMVQQGPAKFGGTMKMLGALTTKVCYWLRAGGGGCSLGVKDWRYEAIGAQAYTYNGVVTMGAIYTHYERLYNTAQGAYSALTASGARFPWTTGSRHRHRRRAWATQDGPLRAWLRQPQYDHQRRPGDDSAGDSRAHALAWLHVDYETAGIGDSQNQVRRNRP